MLTTSKITKSEPCVFVCFWNKKRYKFSIFLKLEMGGQANSLIRKKRGGGKQNKKEYLHLRFRVAFFLLKLIRLV